VLRKTYREAKGPGARGRFNAVGMWAKLCVRLTDGGAQIPQAYLKVRRGRAPEYPADAQKEKARNQRSKRPSGQGRRDRVGAVGMWAKLCVRLTDGGAQIPLAYLKVRRGPDGVRRWARLHKKAPSRRSKRPSGQGRRDRVGAVGMWAKLCVRLTDGGAQIPQTYLKVRRGPDGVRRWARLHKEQPKPTFKTPKRPRQ
jgi:hypothetical protein